MNVALFLSKATIPPRRLSIEIRMSNGDTKF